MYKENKKEIYIISNGALSPCGKFFNPASSSYFTLFKCKGFENGWGELEIEYCEVKKINLSYSDYDKFKSKSSYYGKKIECYNKFE